MKTLLTQSNSKQNGRDNSLVKACLRAALYGLIVTQCFELPMAAASQNLSHQTCENIVTSRKNLAEILVSKSVRDQLEKMVLELDKELKSGRRFVNSDRSLFLEVGRQLTNSIHLLSDADLADRMNEVFARDISAAGKLPGFGANDSVTSMRDLVHDLSGEAYSTPTQGPNIVGQMWGNWLRNSLQMSPASSLVLGLHESNEPSVLVNPHRVLSEIEAAVLQRETIQRLHGPDRNQMLSALGVEGIRSAGAFEQNLNSLWLSIQPQGKIIENDLRSQRLNFEFSSESIRIKEVNVTAEDTQEQVVRSRRVVEVSATALNEQMRAARKKVQEWKDSRLRDAYLSLLTDLKNTATNENEGLENIETIPKLLSFMSDEIVQAYRNAIYQYPEPLRGRLAKEMRVKFFAQPGRKEGLHINPLGADLVDVLSMRLQKLGALEIFNVANAGDLVLDLEIGKKNSDFTTLELALYAEEIVRRFDKDHGAFFTAMGLTYPSADNATIESSMRRLRQYLRRY